MSSVTINGVSEAEAEIAIAHHLQIVIAYFEGAAPEDIGGVLDRITDRLPSGSQEPAKRFIEEIAGYYDSL